MCTVKKYVFTTQCLEYIKKGISVLKFNSENQV